jgi:hypothetical protein
MSAQPFILTQIHSVTNQHVRNYLLSLVPGLSRPQRQPQIAALPQLNSNSASAAPTPHDASRAVRQQTASSTPFLAK